jgi:hypothetical protein
MTEAKKSKYLDKFQLLNKSEFELYQRIQEAAPKLICFCQVSMSQVFFFFPGRKDTFTKLGEIGRKSIDFLLCRQDDTSIVAAIELNGPRHGEADQKISDEKKKAALEEAGIPLLVFTPNPLPDVKTIRDALAPMMVERRKYEAEKKERIQKKES